MFVEKMLKIFEQKHKYRCKNKTLRDRDIYKEKKKRK